MICVKDAAMGVVHLSPEWLGFTGFELGGAMGQGWLAAVHPDDRAMARDTLRAAAEARRGYSMDYRPMRRSGVGVWVSDGAVASSAPGEPSFLGVLGSITEIPERDRPAAARGRVGEFRPMPPAPSTLTAEPPAPRPTTCCSHAPWPRVSMIAALSRRSTSRCTWHAVGWRATH